MRELSMMFSSPAFEVDNTRRRHDHSNASRIDESSAYQGKPDVSFGNVGDGLLLDNSICNTGSDGMQSVPFAKRTPFEKSKDDNKTSENDDGGFVIFEDEEGPTDGNKTNKFQSGSGFQIYDEGYVNTSQQKTGESSKQNLESKIGFQIYEENEENSQEIAKSNLETGDTANIADAIALLDRRIVDKEDDSFTSDESNQYTASGGGETADLNLFNEVFLRESEPDDERNESKKKEVKRSTTSVR